MRRLGHFLANVAIFGILYAIGIALWLDLIRSGWLTPEIVAKIVTGGLEAVR